LRPPHTAAESPAKTSLDLESQEKGPTLPNDKKLRFLIETLSKSMREKSGCDFLEFGSRGQGGPRELEAPKSRWDSIVFIGFQQLLIYFYRCSMIFNEIV
jgi:hypothetical protein